MSPEYAREWIRKAHADFVAANRALQDCKKNSDQSEIACFHAQQCAEKWLKALLSHHGCAVARVHDLLALARSCKKLGFPASRLEKGLRLLNQYAVEIRYPGATATIAEARKAVAAMRLRVQVCGKILKHID